MCDGSGGGGCEAEGERRRACGSCESKLRREDDEEEWRRDLEVEWEAEREREREGERGDRERDCDGDCEYERLLEGERDGERDLDREPRELEGVLVGYRSSSSPSPSPSTGGLLAGRPRRIEMPLGVGCWPRAAGDGEAEAEEGLRGAGRGAGCGLESAVPSLTLRRFVGGSMRRASPAEGLAMIDAMRW